MKRLAPAIRIYGTLLKYLPGTSISKMSTESIRNSRKELPSNSMTNAILGKIHDDVEVEDREIDSDGRNIPIRLYVKKSNGSKPKSIILYIHGGAWALGSLRVGDWIASNIAHSLDAVVLSVGYRLAPEDPFPAGLNDCYTSLLWAMENADEISSEGSEIGVVGESAGGNLAAVVCQMALRQQGPKIRHQVLIYPAIDGAMDTDSYRINQNAIVLTSADMESAYTHYLGEDGDRLDWRVSPIRSQNLAGLPSATIIVAGHDPLRDEAIAYGNALNDAGAEVNVKEFKSMPHGFMNFPNFSRDAQPAIEFLIHELWKNFESDKS